MKTIFLCTLFSLLLIGCTSPEVEMVQNGSLEMCKNVTVKEMVESFMGSPSWESGESSGGLSFVNVSGDITFQEKPVRALLQFDIDKDSGVFGFNAIEFNEIPQNNFMALGLLKKMCESAN